MPLNRLTVKEFKSKEMQIDAPIDHEIMTDAASHLHDEQAGLEEKYYGIINSKDLYKKY